MSLVIFAVLCLHNRKIIFKCSAKVLSIFISNKSNVVLLGLPITGSNFGVVPKKYNLNKIQTLRNMALPTQSV